MGNNLLNQKDDAVIEATMNKAQKDAKKTQKSAKDDIVKKNKKVGRPLIDIDWVEFEKLCAMHCTQEEIADWFRCTMDTIQNRCKIQYGKDFFEVYQEKKGTGKISLRRKQWQVALGGNITMLIWLGKQYLNQKDTNRTELAGVDGLPLGMKSQVVNKIDLSDKSAEELKNIRETIKMLEDKVNEKAGDGKNADNT